MNGTIDTVVFDLGGVLVDLRRDRCIEAFRRLGYARIDRILDLYYPAEIFRRLERGEISTETMCDYFREEIGREIPSETIEAAYLQFIGSIPRYKLAAIRRLKRHGIRTLLLSNLSERIYRHVSETEFRKEGYAIDAYFEARYLSFEMHRLKPDPELFLEMIERSGLDPARTFFIDDGAKNIETARNLGFRTHLARPREDFTPLLDRMIRYPR